MGNKGHLPLVAIPDVNVVISLMNIEFCQVISVFQLVYKVRDKRERVCVMGGVFIEVVVVLTGMKFAILLFDKEEGGCLGGVGGPDFSYGKVLFKEALCGFLFIREGGVDFSDFWYKRFVKIYLIVIGTGRRNVVSCFFGEDLGIISIL